MKFIFGKKKSIGISYFKFQFRPKPKLRSWFRLNTTGKTSNNRWFDWTLKQNFWKIITSFFFLIASGEASSPESINETKIDETDNLENIQEKNASEAEVSKISAIDVEMRSDISTDSCREPPRKKIAVETSKVSDNDSGISTTNNANLTISSPSNMQSKKKEKGTLKYVKNSSI